MKIKGSIKTEASFGLIDGILTIRQGGVSFELTPEQSRALAEFILESLPAEEKHWSVIEGE